MFVEFLVVEFGLLGVVLWLLLGHHGAKGIGWWILLVVCLLLSFINGLHAVLTDQELQLFFED